MPKQAARRRSAWARARATGAALLLLIPTARSAGFDFRVPARAERRQLFWVHVPRTGAAFRRHLLHAACPRAHNILRANARPRRRDAYVNSTVALGRRTRPECVYDFLVDSFFEHAPLPRGGLGSYVPILLAREPASWVVSSFWSGAARPGLSALPSILRYRPDALVPGAVKGTTARARAALLRKSVAALGETPHPIRTYAALVTNCATKMLLGYACYAQVEEELDAGRAISIVRAAGFVGLTERFADSLLLFRRTFDFDTRARMPRPSAAERRPKKPAYAPADLSEGLGELRGWRTPDHDVYDVAVRLFDARFRRSGEEILDFVLSLPA